MRRPRRARRRTSDEVPPPAARTRILEPLPRSDSTSTFRLEQARDALHDAESESIAVARAVGRDADLVELLEDHAPTWSRRDAHAGVAHLDTQLAAADLAAQFHRPCGVYLMAFDSRLRSIWPTSAGSECTRRSASSMASAVPCCWRRRRNRAAARSNSAARSKSVSSSLMAPDSSLLMSSSALSSRDMASTACSCCAQHVRRHSVVADHPAQRAIQQCPASAAAGADRGSRSPGSGSWRDWRVRRRGARPLSACSACLRSVTSRMAAATTDVAALRDRAQADLDREFRAVLAHAEQLEPDAHRAHAHVVRVVAAMADVARAESLGQQHLDRAADESAARMAEQRDTWRFANRIVPGRVDDDHRVRGRIENAPDELGGEHGHAGQAELRRTMPPPAMARKPNTYARLRMAAWIARRRDPDIFPGYPRGNASTSFREIRCNETSVRVARRPRCRWYRCPLPRRALFDERRNLGFSNWRSACRAAGLTFTSIAVFTFELLPCAMRRACSASHRAAARTRRDVVSGRGARVALAHMRMRGSG